MTNYLFVVHYESGSPKLYFEQTRLYSAAEIMMGARRGHMQIFQEHPNWKSPRGGTFLMKNNLVVYVNMQSDLGSPTIDDFVLAAKEADLKIWDKARYDF